MMKPLIGITMGDPSGVGPEILIRSARKIRAFSKADAVIFGDFSYLQRVYLRLSKSHEKLTFPFFSIPASTLPLWSRSKRKLGSIPIVDLHVLSHRRPVFG